MNIEKEIQYIKEVTNKAKEQYLRHVVDGTSIHKLYNIIQGVMGFLHNAERYYENENINKSQESIQNSKKCLNDLLEFVGNKIN